MSGSPSIISRRPTRCATTKRWSTSSRWSSMQRASRSRFTPRRSECDRAFETVTAGKQFSDEQQKWLDRIRDHLVENLSIDRDDFENRPGIHSLRRLGPSESRLSITNSTTILNDLNEAIAA